MDISELSLFASDDLTAKTVTLYDNGDPVEGVVYIRILPSTDIDRFALESKDPSMDIRVQSVPRLISKAVRKADGKAHFSVEQAGKLTNANRTALLKAVTEVNKVPDEDDLGN